jgi:hypothetical protein
MNSFDGTIMDDHRNRSLYINCENIVLKWLDFGCDDFPFPRRSCGVRFHMAIKSSED